ncbi:uncharacterized protein [Cicer arietinum]|uniref:uncharacterized protein n=1 Tax=Cicer arietinum TaxID=3827 RepID=UPI003CC5D5AD
MDNNCDKRKLLDNNYCSAEKSAITHSEKSAMVTVRDGAQGTNEWYLESGCSTHMTGRKDWFVKINQAMRSRVKFADDTTLAADGIGDVLIMRRDGGHSLIKDVLYIPGIKCNLLSIGQLLERNYMIQMENKVLRVLDQNGVLILKAPMAANRTFKIESKIMEHRCLTTAASRDEWLWHYRLGHLNFRDLNTLQKYEMVTGLPSINIPAEIYEECIQGKQHKNSFSKDAGHRTKHQLEVVYSDVMLKGKNLPKELWGEAVATAAYVLNMCPTKKLEKVTPEEVWSGFKPNLSHLRVFGSVAFQHIPGQLQKKLDDKSEMMLLVGYHPTGGYKLFDVSSNCESYISKFKEELTREFEMTDLGTMKYFLGIEFQKTKLGLLMHQKRNPMEILKRCDMEHCNAATTPAEARLQLSKSEDEQDVDPTQYRRLIGSLRYLCNMRPDLAFSVGIASRFMERPKVSHLAAVKRILRCVKGTLGCGILFPANDMGKSCELLGYTDSNWCGDKDDRKSTAGYVFMFGGAPISWCSKKEPVVALSSCEAEYIIASLCACQAVWLVNLLRELDSNTR